MVIHILIIILQTRQTFYLKLSAIPALFFAFIALTGSNASSQFRAESAAAFPAAIPCPFNESTFFTGALTNTQVIPGLQEESKSHQTSHKSGFLAAGLSFILPGLGEYYVGDQIWRGVIFTALDAVFLYEQFHFSSRGDDSTNAFHLFADSLWLPQKYADTLNHLLTKAGNSYQVTGDPNAPDYFAKINRAEDSVRRIYGDDGAFPLSHSLPERGSQQFYELISKYQQFTYAWKDFFPGGPLYSPDYERHAQMRENMNYQYEVARYFLWGMFLNRVLSAIDAALLAKDHNAPIHLEGELQKRQYPDGRMGVIPTAKLRYRF